MNIPKNLFIFGRTWTIEWVDDLLETRGCLGEVLYNSDKIRIASSAQVTRESKEHTFFHELTHVILHEMRKDQLCDDESFVNIFAGLLYEVLKPSLK
jgi:hypothetical protein